MGEQWVQIAVGRPVRSLFTYRLPEALNELSPGQRVVVPFGRGKAVGFVIAKTSIAPPVKGRDILEKLDEEPIFDNQLLSFIQWTANYYCYPLGEALRSALPPILAKPRQKPKQAPRVNEWVAISPQGREGPRPRSLVMNAILDYLVAVNGEADYEELATAIPGARAPLKKLVEKGLCFLRQEPLIPLRPELELSGKPAPKPTQEQTQALEILNIAIEDQKFAPFLLHGVTGSGKTEIYLRAIERALACGLGGLVLVPEIALTPQLVGRFRARFGEKVAVLHSGLRDAERLREWSRLRKGEAPLAVGVRSAIFAPVKNLGIIVVDEEHDGSFKQEEKLRYHARDLAVVRGRMASCPVILGSATPSLETLHNAKIGKYRLIELLRRVDDRPMPEVQIVDMRLSGPGHVSAAFPQLAGRAKLRAAEKSRALEQAEKIPSKPTASYSKNCLPQTLLPLTSNLDEEISHGPPLLSPELVGAIDEVLVRKQQAILFLNRRGQLTYHLCMTCGQSLSCVDCAVSLTLHARRGLMCHYCGHQEPLPEICPSCGGALEGLGMGTERVEEELSKRFPEARICRLDRDSATQAEEVTALLASFAKGEKDILVGTQRVAKGHDFPGVTLVGVLRADLALNLPDFRAAERTFALLAQVAGRAGRGQEAGKVVVQTFNPEAAAIACVVGHDYAAFSERELKLRKAYFYPPFCRLLAVRIEGADPAKTAQAARIIARATANGAKACTDSLRILGPSPAPLSRLKGQSRWQILVKSINPRSLATVAQAIEKATRDLPSGTRAIVDIDPMGLL